MHASKTVRRRRMGFELEETSGGTTGQPQWCGAKWARTIAARERRRKRPHAEFQPCATTERVSDGSSRHPGARVTANGASGQGAPMRRLATCVVLSWAIAAFATEWRGPDGGVMAPCPKGTVERSECAARCCDAVQRWCEKDGVVVGPRWRHDLGGRLERITWPDGGTTRVPRAP